VGPDNGLFGWTRADPEAEARHIDLHATGLGTPSATFHGRDVFAPIAARIAAGALALDAVGPRVTLAVDLPPPALVERGGALEGSVVLADHFGNLITNIHQHRLVSLAEVRVRIGARECGLVAGYFSVRKGELLALIGSSGVLEVSIRQGNAARELGAGPGTPVIVSGTRPEGSL
jgi:hypothetical protein